MFKRLKELQSLENYTRRRLKELEDLYKELVEKQRILEHNNTVLLLKNNELTERMHQINSLVVSNKCGNIEVISSKIKELTADDGKC